MYRRESPDICGLPGLAAKTSLSDDRTEDAAPKRRHPLNSEKLREFLQNDNEPGEGLLESGKADPAGQKSPVPELPENFPEYKEEAESPHRPLHAPEGRETHRRDLFFETGKSCPIKLNFILIPAIQHHGLALRLFAEIKGSLICSRGRLPFRFSQQASQSLMGLLGKRNLSFGLRSPAVLDFTRHKNL